MTSTDVVAEDSEWPGPLDIHLFNEGRHRRLWQLLGAQVLPSGVVRFTVWAPNAKAVYVVGDWKEWGDGTLMEPIEASGIRGAVVRDARPGQCYKFAVVDRRGHTILKADPMARQAE